MKTVNINRSNRYALLVLAGGYLFIAISHIFFLPHYNIDNTTTPVVSNSVFKSHTVAKSQQEATYVKRTDKTTLNDKKKALADVTAVATLVFLLINVFGVLIASKAPSIPRKYLFANRQYSYLSLCTFRI